MVWTGGKSIADNNIEWNTKLTVWESPPWQTNEPNGALRSCVNLHADLGTFNDDACSESYSFICERRDGKILHL